jgi:hypothetical protein
MGTRANPFPCPFCQSGQVVLTGGGRAFLHYRCSACSEVWTAQAMRAMPGRQAITGAEATEDPELPNPGPHPPRPPSC